MKPEYITYDYAASDKWFLFATVRGNDLDLRRDLESADYQVDIGTGTRGEILVHRSMYRNARAVLVRKGWHRIGG